MRSTATGRNALIVMLCFCLWPFRFAHHPLNRSFGGTGSAETLQMQTFRLLTFAASSQLMATAQASSPLRSDQVLYPMSSLGFPPVSELVLRPTLG